MLLVNIYEKCIISCLSSLSSLQKRLFSLLRFTFFSPLILSNPERFIRYLVELKRLKIFRVTHKRRTRAR